MIHITDNGCAGWFLGTERVQVGFWFRLTESTACCWNVHDGYWSVRLWRFGLVRRPPDRT